MLNLIFSLKVLIVYICILLSVAFITLFERKTLSYLQMRVGPSKWGFKGILQPFSDAIKLFTKKIMFLSFSNLLLYFSSPIMFFCLSLLVWLSFPSYLGGFEISLSIMFILVCLSMGVYPIFAAGWASNSKYSLLGGLRAIAQTISYEVSFAIIFLSLVIISNSLMLEGFLKFSQYNLFLAPFLSGVWFLSALAETNRTPFDFSEGESELVSGFNTEFSAGPFALFFLAEYASILFMSLLFIIMFFSAQLMALVIMIKMVFSIFLFLWVRGTLPRMRYDKLMMLAWKVFLPLTLSYLIYFSGLILIQFI